MTAVSGATDGCGVDRALALADRVSKDVDDPSAAMPKSIQIIDGAVMLNRQVTASEILKFQ